MGALERRSSFWDPLLKAHFQQSLVPILLVGPQGWSEAAKHILFPTDLSEAATTHCLGLYRWHVNMVPN